jgi:hypothetical protein
MQTGILLAFITFGCVCLALIVEFFLPECCKERLARLLSVCLGYGDPGPGRLPLGDDDDRRTAQFQQQRDPLLPAESEAETFAEAYAQADAESPAASAAAASAT